MNKRPFTTGGERITKEMLKSVANDQRKNVTVGGNGVSVHTGPNGRIISQQRQNRFVFIIRIDNDLADTAIVCKEAHFNHTTKNDPNKPTWYVGQGNTHLIRANPQAGFQASEYAGFAIADPDRPSQSERALQLQGNTVVMPGGSAAIEWGWLDDIRVDSNNEFGYGDGVMVVHYFPATFEITPNVNDGVTWGFAPGTEKVALMAPNFLSEDFAAFFKPGSSIRTDTMPIMVINGFAMPVPRFEIETL